MFGAIIGDLAGGIYEYNQIKEIKSVRVDNIIEKNAFYSDDTILTIAIADAILHNGDYEKYLKYYIRKYSNYQPDFKPYFKHPFSPSIMKWSKSNNIGTSMGNGAIMRISPVGYLFNSEQEIIKNARLATEPSHNSFEAIDCATKVALIIYYLRMGRSMESVFAQLNIKPKFTPFEKFNSTCKETLNNCLYVLFYSHSFEDAIRNIISLGGDTDTNACIVGSMAEAIYGISDELIQKANDKLPQEFSDVLSRTRYKKMKE